MCLWQSLGSCLQVVVLGGRGSTRYTGLWNRDQCCSPRGTASRGPDAIPIASTAAVVGGVCGYLLFHFNTQLSTTGFFLFLSGSPRDARLVVHQPGGAGASNAPPTSSCRCMQPNGRLSAVPGLDSGRKNTLARSQWKAERCSFGPRGR